MHEIITLQFGPLCNYLCTHYWNAQDSYLIYTANAAATNSTPPVNSDLSFRAGVAPDGSDTYTPRTLIYDFRASFGSLRREELYSVGTDVGTNHDIGRSSALWTSGTPIQRIEQARVSEAAYTAALNAGVEQPRIGVKDVRYWSDYSRVFYHPRSVVQVYAREIGGQGSGSGAGSGFVGWEEGTEFFEELDREVDVLDRDLRRWVEECDQLQGFQVVAEARTGWAGWTARYLERVVDEYGKKSIFTFGIDDGDGEDAGGAGAERGVTSTSAARRAARTVNAARSVLEIGGLSSVYIPTAIPNRLEPWVSLDRSVKWHTSALQMTAFETMLLPTRLRSMNGMHGTTTMENLAAFMTEGGTARNVARLSLSMLDVQRPSNGVSGHVHHLDRHRDLSLFPENNLRSNGRGENDEDEHIFAEARVIRDDMEDDGEPAQTMDTDEADQFVQTFHTNHLFPTPSSFPPIYNLSKANTKSVRVSTRLAMSSTTGVWIKDLARAAVPRVPYDYREEFSNGLQELADTYKWGFDGGSDDDWD